MKRSRLYLKAQPGSVIRVGSTLVYVLGTAKVPLCIEADTLIPIDYLTKDVVRKLASDKKIS